MATKFKFVSLASLILSSVVLSAGAAELGGNSVVKNSAIPHHIHEVTSPDLTAKGNKVSESQKYTQMVDMEAVQFHLFTTYRNL